MARNPFDDTDAEEGRDVDPWQRLIDMEARIMARLDRHEDAARDSIKDLHVRANSIEEKVGKVAADLASVDKTFAEHRGRIGAISVVVGIVVSGFVSFVVKLLPGGGGH